jgi:hypothetical protein
MNPPPNKWSASDAGRHTGVQISKCRARPDDFVAAVTARIGAQQVPYWR